MDGIEIRVTSPEEYRTASDTVSNALMHPPSSDDQWSETGRLGSWEESDSLSAWDGDRCVGHAAGYRLDTLVPGGAWLPTNGVTRVGVLATHRRRGLLRALMTRLLVDAHGRGQVLASLRASETQIYQRYGFGLAGRCTEVMVSSRSALPITGIAANGTLRLLRPDEILPTIVDIYERAARRPGVLKRPQWMWQRYLEKAIELGGDAEYVVVHTSPDGVDDGYAHYLTKWNEVRFAESRGAGEVYDLWGETPAIELALWDYLCNIDLVDEWFGEERPVDDVVQFAVADPRAVQVKSVYDEQWLRLLDVDAALTSRTYVDVDSSVTIGVTDPLLPHNDGTWNVSAAGAKRIGDDDTAADLSVDVGTLSAAYLGGTPWRSLVAAGRALAGTRAAADAADALFAVPEAPYCCSGF